MYIVSRIERGDSNCYRVFRTMSFLLSLFFIVHYDNIRGYSSVKFFIYIILYRSSRYPSIFYKFAIVYVLYIFSEIAIRPCRYELSEEKTHIFARKIRKYFYEHENSRTFAKYLASDRSDGYERKSIKKREKRLSHNDINVCRYRWTDGDNLCVACYREETRVHGSTCQCGPRRWSTYDF